MKRGIYYNYISEKLMVLMYNIKQNGKLNLNDLNIHVESLFTYLLNVIFNYELINMNSVQQNVESIDLRDDVNKVIVQVSSTSTKQKIENTLIKESLQEYSKLNYRIKFMLITDDAGKLKDKKFDNKHNIFFEPEGDIIDINDILRTILNMTIDKQKIVFDFIKKELGEESDIVKIDSNLATIINILANESLDEIDNKIELHEFNIDKKIEFNNLKTVKDTINDYKVFYGRLDEKYREFDKQGVNKSLSVFQKVKNIYVTLVSEQKYNEDQVFLKVIERVVEIIQCSRNYVEIPFEELEMYVSIVVVDAFIRCKIFRNPEGYSYVIT
ncbi:ABC-three component system protein [Acetivibrio cellulolyticus]|uniref:ABC-three component system protein n=1 Tax=Acetivibrio cellulolyticus TaxID=35830 RepID=UPI0001E2BA57|nr:ABC-three component system protein [Acetivibrio cellulolyticus]